MTVKKRNLKIKGGKKNEDLEEAGRIHEGILQRVRTQVSGSGFGK